MTAKLRVLIIANSDIEFVCRRRSARLPVTKAYGLPQTGFVRWWVLYTGILRPSPRLLQAKVSNSDAKQPVNGGPYGTLQFKVRCFCKLIPTARDFTTWVRVRLEVHLKTLGDTGAFFASCLEGCTNRSQSCDKQFKISCTVGPYGSRTKNSFSNYCRNIWHPYSTVVTKAFLS